MSTEGKMAREVKYEDERIHINQRITELEEQLSEMIQKHIDFMYTRERTHNMECQ